MTKTNKKINKAIKQSIIPGIEQMEMHQLKKDIDLQMNHIQDYLHQLIDIQSIEAKKNSIQTLKLIKAGLQGLVYLRQHAQNQGVVTLTRTRFDITEKIQVKARAKKNIEGDDGKIMEKVTSELKVTDETFKPIDWDEYETLVESEHKNRIGKSGIYSKDFKPGEYLQEETKENDDKRQRVRKDIYG